MFPFVLQAVFSQTLGSGGTYAVQNRSSTAHVRLFSGATPQEPEPAMTQAGAAESDVGSVAYAAKDRDPPPSFDAKNPDEMKR